MGMHVVMETTDAAAPVSGWALWIPLLVAVVALVGVAAGTWQKAINDRREAWWKRAQWAMERLEPEEHTPNTLVAERRAIAVESIAYCSTSRLARRDEYEYFLEVFSKISGVGGS